MSLKLSAAPLALLLADASMPAFAQTPLALLEAAAGRRPVQGASPFVTLEPAQ